MRASRMGIHISGAERITSVAKLDHLAAELTRRALDHSRGVPDQVHVTIDAIDNTALVKSTLPDITTIRVDGHHQGRQAALAELVSAGVAEGVAGQAIRLLAGGANPAGGALRGALLVEARSGTRLDPDPCRGVRATRMDLSTTGAAALHTLLAPHGLDTCHVREALVLAGKVMGTPGYVAELCWSDDPDYSAGYVCSSRRGYVRFPHLKALGDENGGRVFFVDGQTFDLQGALNWLERTPVLFDAVGQILPDEIWYT